MAIITLLTDFGTQDEYVGVMKGVMLTIAPAARIVDISHHIGPQNILQAAFMLASTVAYFPAGTVHIAVVDPGVGSDRRILAAEAAGQILLAPDNGLLTVLSDNMPIRSMVWVENSRFFNEKISRTFHGRDIFAPVGAHLAGGLPLHRLGRPARVDEMVRLDVPVPRIADNGDLLGAIVAVDRFGNLMTCIHVDRLALFCPADQQGKLIVRIGAHGIHGISSHYSSVALHDPVALIGSRGFLEIGVNGGNACARFDSRIGDTVQLHLPPTV